MTYRFNYLNATEKRQAQKEQGRNNIPECDGQVKHPEHLWRHDHLQILQREALRGNLEKCREMLGAQLNTIHNVYYYQSLMKGIRRAITENRLNEFSEQFYVQQDC